MLPAIYGNQYQIVQAPGYVAIMYEMIHETRVIPLDGRPAIGKGIEQDMGDARGHWEGDTLVVETTNFKERSAYRNANAATLKLTERFTAHRPGQSALDGDRGRPEDLDAAVDVLAAADRRSQPAAALRVPRGQLRVEEHLERGSRRGESRKT